VIDTNEGVRQWADVVVREGRVVAVSDAPDLPPAECRVEIDAVGGTVLPALGDGHVHLGSLLARDDGALGEWPRQGVTTVVDLGSRLPPGELKARVAASAPLTVFAAGPVLTAPGGYPFASDRSSAFELTGAAAVEAAIAGLAGSGLDLVKVSIERGFLADLDEPGWPVLSRDLLRRVVEVAHAHGLRVVAHLTQSGELAAALAAGVDAVAHTPIEPLIEAQILEAGERGVVFVSTLGLWTDREHLEAACSNLRRLLDAGGRVALGTDAPAFAEPGLPWNEIERLRACPLSSLEILQALTDGVAHLVGSESDRGIVAPGVVADLLIVDGDPLEDLSALRRVRAVIHEGVIVEGGRMASTAGR